MVFGAGSKEMMAVGAVGAGIKLAAKLDKEAIVYQTDGATCQRVLDDLRSVLVKGKPITVSDLKAPKQEDYKVIDIEDGGPPPEAARMSLAPIWARPDQSGSSIPTCGSNFRYATWRTCSPRSEIRRAAAWSWSRCSRRTSGMAFLKRPVQESGWML
jgi:hypothetical protein